MIRRQVVIEESQNRAVVQLARERGVGVSELIRDLIEREIDRSRSRQIERSAEALRDAYLADPDLQDFSVLDTEGLHEKG